VLESDQVLGGNGITGGIDYFIAKWNMLKLITFKMTTLIEKIGSDV